MKINLKYVIYFFILIISCTDKNQSDSALLEKDKLELVKNLDADKITTYKFGKILIRASVEKNTISPEFQSFKSDLDRIFNKAVKYDINNTESLSLLDYISIYRDYKKMQDFIIKTDEDVFPTLSDAFNVAYGDSVSKKQSFYSGKDKLYAQNIEHGVLSAIVVLSKDLGKEVSLYECSKTNPTLLPDSEIKTLLQFYRGFLFFEKKLHYLSEDEITSNINWLNKNKNVDMSLTKAFFKWGNLSNDQTHIAFHSLNHLFRGFDRLMMEREIDEKRALEDFEVFLKDANKIGLSNEIVWSIETYLYLKKEDNAKAINSLNKLKNSDLLSSSDKKNIDESIEYLKDRKSGKVLNGFFDKFFLSKIATKYMFAILSKVDWEKVLKEQNIPRTDKMFEIIKRLKEFNENLTKYSSGENLKETTNEIKNEGKNLWDKTKKALE